MQGANRKKAACVQLCGKKSKKSGCERAGAGHVHRGSCERIMKRDVDPTLITDHINAAWKIDVACLLY